MLQLQSYLLTSMFDVHQNTTVNSNNINTYHIYHTRVLTPSQFEDPKIRQLAEQIEIDLRTLYFLSSKLSRWSQFLNTIYKLPLVIVTLFHCY